MSVAKELKKRKVRRGFRIRNHVRRSSNGRPRLSVHRTNKHMYAQLIDDATGTTLVSASTVEKTLYGTGQAAGNVEAAAKVGSILAERAKAAGITQVIFDRGTYRYHGRVAALAEAAREGGLDF